MAQQRQARLYYVVGMVQGVGYRFFAQRVAQRLGVTGYVKNLPDGRVEVYAIGSPEQLRSLRAELKRGPQAAEVSAVYDQEAELHPPYDGEFSVEHNGW